MAKYFIAACILLLLLFGAFSIYQRYEKRVEASVDADKKDETPANKWGIKGVKTPLHMAAFNQPLEKIKQMLDLGANPNAKDEYGQTPLHYAAHYNRMDVVKLMLEYGGNPDVEDSYGWRPLNMVVEKPENEEMLEFLEEITTERAPRNILDGY